MNTISVEFCRDKIGLLHWQQATINEAWHPDNIEDRMEVNDLPDRSPDFRRNCSWLSFTSWSEAGATHHMHDLTSDDVTGGCWYACCGGCSPRAHQSVTRWLALHDVIILTCWLSNCCCCHHSYVNDRPITTLRSINSSNGILSAVTCCVRIIVYVFTEFET